MVKSFIIFTNIKGTPIKWQNWWHRQSWSFIKGHFNINPYLDPEILGGFRQLQDIFGFSKRQAELRINPSRNVLTWLSKYSRMERSIEQNLWEVEVPFFLKKQSTVRYINIKLIIILMTRRINPLHATGLFLYFLKTSENQRFIGNYFLQKISIIDA